MTPTLLAGALLLCLLLVAPAVAADPVQVDTASPTDLATSCVGYNPDEYPYVYIDTDCIST
jgi:hypothetical protein